MIHVFQILDTSDTHIWDSKGRVSRFFFEALKMTQVGMKYQQYENNELAHT